MSVSMIVMLSCWAVSPHWALQMTGGSAGLGSACYSRLTQTGTRREENSHSLQFLTQSLIKDENYFTENISLDQGDKMTASVTLWYDQARPGGDKGLDNLILPSWVIKKIISHLCDLRLQGFELLLDDSERLEEITRTPGRKCLLIEGRNFRL